MKKLIIKLTVSSLATLLLIFLIFFLGISKSLHKKQHIPAHPTLCFVAFNIEGIEHISFQERGCGDMDLHFLKNIISERIEFCKDAKSNCHVAKYKLVR